MLQIKQEARSKSCGLPVCHIGSGGSAADLNCANDAVLYIKVHRPAVADRRIHAAGEPALAVAVPDQNAGGHIVGASAVVDRRCADPRGGGDLAELGQIGHRCEAALSRNRRDKVADLNGIAASLFNRLPSAEIDRDKLVVDRSAGDIRTVRSALGLYHAAIKRRTIARAAQRDQVDLTAAVRAGLAE